jgi:hypothetical protein
MYARKFLPTYIVVGTNSSDALNFGNSSLKTSPQAPSAWLLLASTPISNPGHHIYLRNGDIQRNTEANTGRSHSHFTKMRLVFNEVMTSQDRRTETEMKMFEQRSVAQNLRSSIWDEWHCESYRCSGSLGHEKMGNIPVLICRVIEMSNFKDDIKDVDVKWQNVKNRATMQCLVHRRADELTEK